MERYHGLDAVRAGAMMLGIILHGAVIYTDDWVFQEILPNASRVAPDQPKWVLAMVLWIHLWRMPIFMVLGGFFATMVLERRGPCLFVSDRALRLGGVLLLFLPLHNLTVGNDWARLQHLWFIWWLLLFCGLAALLWRIGWRPPTLRLERFGDLGVLWVFAVALTMLGRESGLQSRNPETLFDPAWRGFLYHGVLFVAGMMLWQGREALETLAKPVCWSFALAAGIGAFLMLMGLEVSVFVGPDGTAATNPPIVLTAVLSATVMLGNVLGFIGFSGWAIRKASRLLKTFTRLAFPVYVLHLYPVLAMSALMHEAGHGPAASIFGSSVAALVICSLVYALFTRTPLDWLFVGPRNAWWRWPLKPITNEKP